MTTTADRKWFEAVAPLETCSLCGAFGVQVAHRNEGRGMGQKSARHMTAALCPECHHAIDNGAKFLQGDRRALMDRAIVNTHSRLIEAGEMARQARSRHCHADEGAQVMTLPQDVQDAVGVLDNACLNGRVIPSEDAWQTIRAHLLSQDAEIARLNAECEQRMLQAMQNGQAAKVAESRIAAADALLLRYCVQVSELSKGLDPHDPIFTDLQKLGADYMAHLQGAGDEA